MKFLLSLLFIGIEAQAITLTDAVRRTWTQSDLIRGQATQYELSSGDRWRRFLPNEPQLQYTSSDDNTAQSYGLSLTVPLPPKLIANAFVDAAKQVSQKAEFDARKYETAKNIIQAYVDCASGNELVEQQTNSISDNEALGKTMRARYESGTATQAENIGIELQIRQQRADLRLSVDRAKLSCLKLKTFLNEPNKISGISLPDDIDADLVREIGEGTADEKRARSAIGVAETSKSVAWWMQLPDLTVSVTRNHYVFLPGSPSGKEDTLTYGVGITIPILFPFRESVEAQRARSQALVERTTAEIQLVNARTDRADGAREYHRSVLRLTELRNKDLALAEALMESTMSAYRTGKLGFAELVLARKTLSDMRSQEIQLKSSIITARLRCLSECESLASDNKENLE